MTTLLLLKVVGSLCCLVGLTALVGNKVVGTIRDAWCDGDYVVAVALALLTVSIACSCLGLLAHPPLFHSAFWLK